MDDKHQASGLWVGRWEVLNMHDCMGGGAPTYIYPLYNNVFCNQNSGFRAAQNPSLSLAPAASRPLVTSSFL